ncbi:WG repeat-containing protein [Nostoc sp.]|uniref:WG repeat-containing protein n=1 Tax=Nostoc sp. TaxID=1180 RepID=UPI002FFCE9CD
MLSLVGAIAFHIIHISQTEKSYPMSMLQKGYETKTENLYPVKFQMSGVSFGTVLPLRNGYAYVNQSAQLVIEPQFDEAGKFSEGFAPIKVKDKWGFINLKGQVSITLQNNTIDKLYSGKRDDHNKSSTDFFNNMDKYSDDKDRLSSTFSEGLVGIKLNGKWGFINHEGKLVIPYQFDEVKKFSGGVVTVRVQDLWGVINPEGKWIIQPINKFPIQFFQGIVTTDLSVRDESGWKIIGEPIIYDWDKSGQLVGNLGNPPVLAKEFHEEMAIIQIPLQAWQEKRDVYPIVATSEYSFVSSARLKCGFQDKQGKVVIKPQFDGCQSFSQGLAAVRVDKKWGYIDKTGKFVVSPQFDYADSLFEERGLVVSNGKIGFIDTTGKIVIKPEFDPNPNDFLKSTFKKFPQLVERKDVMPYLFSSGLAVVSKDDKCGYIDKTGKFAIQPQFLGCERFDSYGVAKVLQSKTKTQNWEEPFYINREGEKFPIYISENSLSKFYPARIKLLASVMACLLWIFAISFHEFGHAIVAYWGGDSSVKDKGYLSFNPRRYINALHTIILPAFFLVIGGIALPGAAVYIEFDQIRNRLWLSATAAAGPIASILFGLLLVPVFHFSIAVNLPHWFSAFIAVFINLQFFIALLNLLPIPPLDGYRIIAVWLPSKLQDRSGIVSLIGLLFICFLLPFIPIAALLFFVPVAFTLVLGISDEFSLGGWYLLDRWYTALPFLVASIIYLIYKPASIFQLAGLVLEKFFPKIALKMYDRAIKIDPKNAWSWERKAWTLSRMDNLGGCVETISAFEEAIKLDPLNRYNRFLWRMLIIELRMSLIFGDSHERLIELIEKFTEFHPKDGWGWGVKALTLDELGNDEEALLAWEKNIKLDPSDRSKCRSQMKESTLERLRS